MFYSNFLTVKKNVTIRKSSLFQLMKIPYSHQFYVDGNTFITNFQNNLLILLSIFKYKIHYK